MFIPPRTGPGRREDYRQEACVGTATLGYPGGPAVAFRIDPDLISWHWEVLTNVIETIGGRVIQVLGARLDDLTVQGSFGQDHADRSGGQSWQLAENFLTVITRIMEAQAADSNQQGRMHPPAVFNYPAKGWRFSVYVKALTDPDNNGSSIVLTPAKANQRYALSLFIVQDGSAALVKAGTTNGAFSQKAYDAASAFMARIADGIGWHFTAYNGQVTGIIGNPGG